MFTIPKGNGEYSVNLTIEQLHAFMRGNGFGETFFRILQRRNSSDTWQVVPGTFDYSQEEDARRTVQTLAVERKGYVVTQEWGWCPACLYTPCRRIEGTRP